MLTLYPPPTWARVTRLTISPTWATMMSCSSMKDVVNVIAKSYGDSIVNAKKTLAIIIYMTEPFVTNSKGTHLAYAHALPL